MGMATHLGPQKAQIDLTLKEGETFSLNLPGVQKNMS
jgi:hypothetical protein